MKATNDAVVTAQRDVPRNPLVGRRQAVPSVSVRGVRRVVTGRLKAENRVTYDDGGERCVPERIVVKRCRRAGYGAYRLPPWIWRALAHVLALRAGSPEAPLESLLGRLPAEGFVRAPGLALVKDILDSVLPRRLNELLARHTGPDFDPRKPGVPDLFVFKRRADGKPYAIRFVEVKRPKEAVKAHQIAEIVFMRSIGLRAGVLRLNEARSTGDASRPPRGPGRAGRGGDRGRVRLAAKKR